MTRRHVVPLIDDPASYLSSIHMEDAGTAVAAALHVPAGTYNVVDDEPLTKREYARPLAAAAGVRPWVTGPGRLALLLGHRTASLTRSLRVANGRFRDASGWHPRHSTAREGWLATVSPTMNRARRRARPGGSPAMPMRRRGGGGARLRR